MSSGHVDPCVLWSRALTVGALAFLLGTIGHVSADGRLPGPGMLGALLVMSVVLSAPALNRPASSLRLVSMLVGGQAGIHLALATTAGHVGDAVATRAARTGSVLGGELPVVDGRRTGSLLDAYQSGAADPLTAPGSATLGHLVSDLSAHAPMMAAHLVAAALVGLWLARGERCLWSLLALTGRLVLARVPSLTSVPSPTSPGVPVSARARFAVADDLRLLQPLWRRGPPAAA